MVKTVAPIITAFHLAVDVEVDVQGVFRVDRFWCQVLLLSSKLGARVCASITPIITILGPCAARESTSGLSSLRVIWPHIHRARTTLLQHLGHFGSSRIAKSTFCLITHLVSLIIC